MLFRIYIPALDKDAVSMTIDVEADNWMLALRYGLDEIGADRDLIKRAICDIKTDKSIHVMEPTEGHVFILREVPPDQKPTVEASAITDEMLNEHIAGTPTPILSIEDPVARTARPIMSDDLPEPPSTANTPLPSWVTQATVTGEPAMDTGATAEYLQAVGDDDDLEVAEEIETSAPDVDTLRGDYPLNEADLEKYFEAPGTGPLRAISHLDLQAVATDETLELGRVTTGEVEQYPEAGPVRSGSEPEPESNEELFTHVFEEMAEIDFVGDTVEEALTYALELAVRRIPSEAGWLLLADMNRRDLYFATATGPRAEDVIDYRLPMGKGLAGFCAVNGVSLALSDVENDPRFQSTISKQIGYKINSVACAPVQHEGRVFGAMQIMNHQDRPEYNPGELEVLNYIARRTAEYLSQHVEI